MKHMRWLAALAALGMGTPAIAADHLDSPSVTEDPSTDITDLFAFVSPSDADKIVLIMAVNPIASADSAFSDAANYTFHVTRNADGVARNINCTFADGAFTCAGPEGSGVMAGGAVGARAEGDSITAWTGMSDDPFFFDLGAFNRTVGADEESNGFCLLDPENGGNGDFFAGLNVLAIVLEVRKEVFLQGEENGVLRIWASTSRQEG